MELNYRTSDGVDKLFESLGEAQKVMTGAVKDAKNPHFGNKYADLASVWDACRQPLADNGLTVLQPVSADGGKVTVTTILAHKTGQWIASDLTLTSAKVDPQGVGSAITYGRRYGLSAMVGIAPEDDDGNAASGKDKEAPKVSRKPQDERADSAAPQAVSMSGKAPTPDALKGLADMQKELGDKLYFAVLAKRGYKSASDIPEHSKAQDLYKELGGVRKLLVAASHGEILPGIDRVFFEALPDTSKAAVFTEMKEKLCRTLGSRDSGLEEFETVRRECQGKSQYEFYVALEKSHEAFSRTGAA